MRTINNSSKELKKKKKSGKIKKTIHRNNENEL